MATRMIRTGKKGDNFHQQGESYREKHHSKIQRMQIFIEHYQKYYLKIKHTQDV